jgi:hypothetical protein
VTLPPLWGWTLVAIGVVLVVPSLLILAITWRQMDAGKARAARRYQDL